MEHNLDMSSVKIKLTTVSILHYIRLIYRSVLLLLLAYNYVKYRLNMSAGLIDHIEERPAIVILIWAVFVMEMVLRFFPSKFESPGCQKQFARNYVKSGLTEISIADNNSIVLIALIWIVFNGIIGALRMNNILDDWIMILLCCVYSVCDMICILFFCPFQTWFMKNKCCSVCRIYNWDYAMMFTPLFFVKRDYMWTLLALSVALLIRWEVTFYLHPERFSENTNSYLRCKNCTEKLCTHKKQLITLWDQIEAYTAERIGKLKLDETVKGIGKRNKKHK